MRSYNNRSLVKPSKLQFGDTIGLFSPSSPLASLARRRADQGIYALEKMGFKVVCSDNAFAINSYTAGTGKQRADDLHQLFLDPEVKAIIAFIGGFHSNQILPYLDFEIIRQNPKIFVGFSDVNILQLALLTQANLVTFYGPTVLCQFAEPFGMDSFTESHFLKAITCTDPIGEVLASTQWTDEFLDWFQDRDLERPKKYQENEGYIWLKEGSARGPILGGCVATLQHPRGTRFFPNFDETVMFWEVPESCAEIAKGEPVARVDSYITDLKLSGVFENIRGMIIGRPMGYTKDETSSLLKVIEEQFAEYNFPILYNVNIGHADPIITLPIGVEVSIDSENNSFTITESGVS